MGWSFWVIHMEKEKKIQAAKRQMINEYTEGRMTVDGREHRKDLKILGRKVAAGWWRKEDHFLDRDDITDVLSASPDVLVVGTGYAGNMRLDESLRRALEDHGIELVAQKTHEAVKTFNKLMAEGKDIAGAFHLTC
jgi:hypothetical protein